MAKAPVMAPMVSMTRKTGGTGKALYHDVLGNQLCGGEGNPDDSNLFPDFPPEMEIEPP